MTDHIPQKHRYTDKDLMRAQAAIFMFLEFLLTLAVARSLQEDYWLGLLMSLPVYLWAVLTLCLWFVINNHTVFKKLWDRFTLLLLDILFFAALLICCVINYWNLQLD